MSGAGTFHEPEGLCFANYRGQVCLLMSIAQGDSGARNCRVYGFGLPVKLSNDLGTPLIRTTSPDFIYRKVLTASDNLNNIWLPGVYVVPSAAVALAIGAPATVSGGELYVRRFGTIASMTDPTQSADGVQEYIQRQTATGGTPRRFIRQSSGGTGSASWVATWREYVTTGNMSLTSISAAPSFVGQTAIVVGVEYKAYGVSSAADWVPSSVLVSSGATANRPTTGLYINRQYLDTTLNKPIWWNGTSWIDALGVSV